MNPETRKDPIVDRWVILAPARAHRPQEFQRSAPDPCPPSVGTAPAPQPSEACPFCAGNEHHTPPAVYARPATGNWQVRVVPNRYPAVAPVEEGRPPRAAGRRPLEPACPSQHVSQPAVGAHEVIIESPHHVSRTGALEAAELLEVLRTYRDRLTHWRGASWARSALVFKNVGAGAGASLSHLHSQLIVLPWIPSSVGSEVESARRYYQQHGSCVFCDLVQRELDCGRRIVLAQSPWVAMTAYAGRQPFETWVLSREHGGCFEDLPSRTLGELADFLLRVFRRVEKVLTTVAYNMILHSSPFDIGRADHYHWHIEIVPRVAELAGFELGGGAFMHSVVPERAAAMLREISV